MQKHQSVIQWGCLFFILACVYGLYSLGFTGILQFDDEANLGWLQFATPENAFIFITSGNSGPLGRPIALLSFYLFNGADWPNNIAAFFRCNTLIHLFNGLLLVWLFSLIGPRKNVRDYWFGLAVGTIWLLQPMLVSTSLMAVQRMTSLSATFVLAGCISYVLARQRLPEKPLSAMMGMTAGMLLFGLLAVFTKENGFLLPAYILILEYTLLSGGSAAENALFKKWRIIALWLPCLIALALFAWKLPDFAASYSSRAFTLQERLQTEIVVLWDYVRQLVSPSRSVLGPFRDDYPIYSDPLSPQVLLGLGLWIITLASALRYRKRFPYFAFAVLWFLVGHSIESTVIPLEIYFEHRNYLPSVGIAALIATFPWQVSLKLRRLASLALIIYCLELAFVLGQTTSTWGQPMLAATLWHEEHPASERATLMLAAEYGRLGDNRQILRLLDETTRYHPRDMGLSTSALYSICFLKDEPKFRARLDDALFRLQNNPLNFSALDALEKLAAHRKEQCPWVTNEDIRRMTGAMMLNRQAMDNNFVRARLHRILASLALDERIFDVFVDEMEQQFVADPQLDSAITLLQAFIREGLWDAAAEKLILIDSKEPHHYLQRQLWEKQLAPIRILIRKNVRQAEHRQ